MSLPTRERGLKFEIGGKRRGRTGSLPTRERGLKCHREKIENPDKLVAPYAGAWIEIYKPSSVKHHVSVAPYAGAWIEMCIIRTPSIFTLVAPYAGAWIEINVLTSMPLDSKGRSLRGSVD